MLHAVVDFLWNQEDGQDLSEYCLLTALIALIALGIFIHVSGGIGNLWSGAHSSLASAPGATPSGVGAHGSQPAGK
jgi:Flp pilus assembly pilin Flp